MHRELPLNKFKRVIVKLTKAEKIYISLIVENYEFPQLSRTSKIVGIDVGIEKLIMTSDGQYFPNLRPYERALKRVRRLQRALSRKKFLSRNWFKAKVRLARAYEHLKNLRHDLYMRLGKWFAEHYDVVVMENIKVKELVGRAYRRRTMLLLMSLKKSFVIRWRSMASSS